MDSLVGTRLLFNDAHHTKLVDAVSLLRDKEAVIFIFSASWCDPCKSTVRKLRELHEVAIHKKIQLLFIYVSSDSDPDLFLKDFHESHGPWYAVPHDELIREELVLKYNVTNIPTVIVTRADGSVVSTQGHLELDKIGMNVLVTWIE